jgi:hypothetical protein
MHDVTLRVVVYDRLTIYIDIDISKNRKVEIEKRRHTHTTLEEL